jgi:uncharacterized membrane protein YdjX (TVP38/TMEM64 family)
VFPFTPMNYAYGLTRVSFGAYALGTVFGMIPGILLFVSLGAAAGEAVKAGGQGRARTPAEWAYLGVGLLATVLVVALVGREARRALAARAKLPD